MKLNPILKKDLTVQSRTYTLPGLITIVNTIVSGIGLMGAFSVITGMRTTGHTDYQRLIELFRYTAAAEYMLMLLVVPALAAGTVAGERESGKLDLLLISNLSGRRLILGKLASVVMQAGVIIVSALPALMIPLIYGGVGALTVANTVFLIFFESVFTACLCLYVSSASSGTVRAMAVSYAYVLAILLISLEVFRYFSEVPGKTDVLKHMMELVFLIQMALMSMLTVFAVLNIKPKRSKIIRL